jgi:hypothetical protein
MGFQNQPRIRYKYTLPKSTGKNKGKRENQFLLERSDRKRMKSQISVATIQLVSFIQKRVAEFACWPSKKQEEGEKGFFCCKLQTQDALKHKKHSSSMYRVFQRSGIFKRQQSSLLSVLKENAPPAQAYPLHSSTKDPSHRGRDTRILLSIPCSWSLQ